MTKLYYVYRLTQLDLPEGSLPAIYYGRESQIVGKKRKYFTGGVNPNTMLLDGIRFDKRYVARPSNLIDTCRLEKLLIKGLKKNPNCIPLNIQGGGIPQTEVEKFHVKYSALKQRRKQLDEPWLEKGITKIKDDRRISEIKPKYKPLPPKFYDLNPEYRKK